VRIRRCAGLGLWKGSQMPDVFAMKTGSLRGVVEVLEPLLEVRFRKFRVDRFEAPWYVALSKDEREHMVLFPNADANGRSLDSAADGYDLLFYLVRSPREEKITRLLSTETRLRFVRPSDRIQELADGVIATLPKRPPTL
jgi:hypothetical protein